MKSLVSLLEVSAMAAQTFRSVKDLGGLRGLARAMASDRNCAAVPVGRRGGRAYLLRDVGAFANVAVRPAGRPLAFPAS